MEPLPPKYREAWYLFTLKQSVHDAMPLDWAKEAVAVVRTDACGSQAYLPDLPDLPDIRYQMVVYARCMKLKMMMPGSSVCQIHVISILD